MKMTYEAYDRAGHALTNTIEASSVEEATRTLQSKGLYVSQIEEGHGATPAPRRVFRGVLGRGQRMKKLAHFTRQFYVLTSTGTPIIDALHALGKQTGDATWRGVIAALEAKVEEGTSLSAAMEEYPQYFDPIYTNLVAAGEASGKLSVILEQLAQLTRKKVHMRSNLIGALLYPCVLSSIGVTVMVLMLTVVVPRFTEMFSMLDAAMPTSTLIVVSIGESMRHYWWGWGGVVVLAVGFGTMTLRSDRGRRSLDRITIRLPLVGTVVRSVVTARIARFLGILLDSHLPLLDALRLVRDATPQAEYAALLTRAEDAVVRGEAISSGFADSELITPSVYQALRSGEAGGRIAPSLLQIADFLDEENEIVMRSMGSIVEPVILVGLGLLIGLVSLSMFTPLFDLTAISGGAG